MSQEKRFSDEFLNAFVDNQIAAEEKSRAYVEIHQNEELNRQVCELRKLHDLVQLAYREPPTPPVHAASGPNSGRTRLRFGVAASFLLTLGIVVGSQVRIPEPSITQQAILSPSAVAPRVATVASFSQSRLRTNPKKTNNVAIKTVSEQIAVAPTANLQQAAATPTADAPTKLAPIAAQSEISGNAQTKVLIHLARDDNTQLGQALDDIEGLLKYYRETNLHASVEVVVNGGGLALVRTDTSAFAERIQRLQREYDNITFAACQNTIDRLRHDKGIIVQLLPGVVTIDSGMAEIMRRQNQGWTYVQV
jgi:intracellular sulfur oxidation DsrE/DsrF family protein/anti-sigma factor RsiW